MHIYEILKDYEKKNSTFFFFFNKEKYLFLTSYINTYLISWIILNFKKYNNIYNFTNIEKNIINIIKYDEIKISTFSNIL